MKDIHLSICFLKNIQVITTAVMLLVSIVAGQYRYPSLQRRVVNGTDTSIQQWPYMVSVRLYNHHKCGGTLIHQMWVLTAAHCIPHKVTSLYGIRHSSSDIGQGEGASNVVNVAQIIVHERYDAANAFKNDITLIRVNRPVLLLRYAHLPWRKFEEYKAGSPAILIGWGWEATIGSVQNQLKMAHLIVFSKKECARRSHKYSIHATNMCAGTLEGGRGQCYGDSGGPLICRGIQVGIVSWSQKPCARYPGVFTQISFYLDWIQKHIVI